MKETNLKINPIGYEYRLNPYMYMEFRAINPNLTKKMYEFLRSNDSEWKILCGIGVKIKYDTEMLAPNWILNIINKDIYENRYNPSYYLNTANWNYANDSR